MKTTFHTGPDLDAARKAFLAYQREQHLTRHDVFRMSIVHGHSEVRIEATWMKTEGGE